MGIHQVGQQGVDGEHQDQAQKVEPAPGAGVLALQQTLRGGSVNVDSIAPIVERFPAEREVMFETLHRSTGNRFVQDVIAALGAHDDAEAAPVDAHLLDVAHVSADTTKLTNDKTTDPAKNVRPSPKKEKQYDDFAVKPAGPRTEALAPDAYQALDGTDVNAIKTSSEEGALLNAVRHEPRRFDAEALQLAQVALGVTNASGAFNTETLRKLAEKTGTTLKHAPKGKPQSAPLLTAANVVDPTFWLPVYDAEAQKKKPLFMAEAVAVAAQDADGSVTTADRAAQKMGGTSYKDYYQRILQPTPKFLGKTIRGARAHPDLIARLAAAEKSLLNFYKDKKDEKQQPYTAERIAKEIRWGGDSVTVYDENPDRVIAKGRVVQKADPAKNLEEKRVGDVYAPVHYHNMGLAVDFDPGVNPYIFDYSTPHDGAKASQAGQNADDRKKNEADRKADPAVEKLTDKDQIDPEAAGKEWATHIESLARAAYKQAADLYGGPALSSSAMAEWSGRLSTEELHAKISAASKSMEKYLADADAAVKEGTEGPAHTKILALFAKAGYDPAQAKQGLEEMKNFTKKFWHSGMHRDGTANGTGTNLKTNRQSLELSVALRDAGGLMWGGTEMSHGGDNGDFMHFDIRQDPTGAQFAAALTEARTPLK